MPFGPNFEPTKASKKGSWNSLTAKEFIPGYDCKKIGVFMQSRFDFKSYIKRESFRRETKPVLFHGETFKIGAVFGVISRIGIDVDTVDFRNLLWLNLFIILAHPLYVEVAIRLTIPS